MPTRMNSVPCIRSRDSVWLAPPLPLPPPWRPPRFCAVLPPPQPTTPLSFPGPPTFPDLVVLFCSRHPVPVTIPPSSPSPPPLPLARAPARCMASAPVLPPRYRNRLPTVAAHWRRSRKACPLIPALVIPFSHFHSSPVFALAESRCHAERRTSSPRGVKLRAPATLGVHVPGLGLGGERARQRGSGSERSAPAQIQSHPRPPPYPYPWSGSWITIRSYDVEARAGARFVADDGSDVLLPPLRDVLLFCSIPPS